MSGLVYIMKRSASMINGPSHNITKISQTSLPAEDSPMPKISSWLPFLTPELLGKPSEEGFADEVIATTTGKKGLEIATCGKNGKIILPSRW